MQIMTRLSLVLIGSMLITGVAAQDPSDDEADVLLRISEAWAAEQKGDAKWVDEMIADNFVGWGKSWPAPRTKDSVRRWERFGQQLGRLVQYEIYPLSVTVDGDLAIAHYLYTSAFKNMDKDGKIEVSNGRYTDILTRTEDGWMFIAWHGGDD